MNTASTSHFRLIFDEVVEHYVKPALLQIGYQKGPKNTFYLSEGDDCFAVECLFQKKRHVDEATANVTVGVGFRSLAEFLASYPPLNWIDVKRPLLIGTNLARLRPLQDEVDWIDWRISHDTSIVDLGTQVCSELLKYGLAFFEDYGSLDKALEAWERGLRFNRGRSVLMFQAAAYWLQGAPEKAIGFIESQTAHYHSEYERSKRRGDWRARIELENFQLFLKTRSNE